MEIHYLLKNKRQTINFNDLDKFQFKVGGTRDPSKLIFITKSNPKKNNKYDVFYDAKKNRDLLAKLHATGIPIEFLGDPDYIKQIKTW